MQYKPLTDKEEIILALSIIHNHTKTEAETYMMDIRDNVTRKWSATQRFIDHEMAKANMETLAQNKNRESNFTDNSNSLSGLPLYPVFKLERGKTAWQKIVTFFIHKD